MNGRQPEHWPNPRTKETRTVANTHVSRSSVFIKLLRFQELDPVIGKNCTANVGNGRSYHYADLANVLRTIKLSLSTCGLVLTQIIDGQDLITRLIDPESGEFIESRFPMELAGLTWHQVGSAITYARRYAILAMLSLAAEDDDAACTVPEKPVTAQLGDCPHCGEMMTIGPKTGQPYCKPCFLAKRNGYASMNGSHA